MLHTSTQIRLIRHLYNESDVTEAQVIDEAIDSDWQLKEEWQNMNLVKDMLDSFSASPSDSSLKIIRRYQEKNSISSPAV